MICCLLNGYNHTVQVLCKHDLGFILCFSVVLCRKFVDQLYNDCVLRCRDILCGQSYEWPPTICQQVVLIKDLAEMVMAVMRGDKPASMVRISFFMKQPWYHTSEEWIRNLDLQ